MNKKAISVESLFVMVLFMVFALSIVIMIMSGKTSYENILNEKENAENMRVTSSYLRVKLIQNKQLGAIEVRHEPSLGIDLLEIKQFGEASEFKTVIYFYQGKVWEAYQAVNEEFNHDLSEAVIDLNAESIRFEHTSKGLRIKYLMNQEEVEQFVALKLEEVK